MYTTIENKSPVVEYGLLAVLSISVLIASLSLCRALSKALSKASATASRRFLSIKSGITRTCSELQRSRRDRSSLSCILEEVGEPGSSDKRHEDEVKKEEDKPKRHHRRQHHHGAPGLSEGPSEEESAASGTSSATAREATTESEPAAPPKHHHRHRHRYDAPGSSEGPDAEEEALAQLPRSGSPWYSPAAPEARAEYSGDRAEYSGDSQQTPQGNAAPAPPLPLAPPPLLSEAPRSLGPSPGCLQAAAASAALPDGESFEARRSDARSSGERLPRPASLPDGESSKPRGSEARRSGQHLPRGDPSREGESTGCEPSCEAEPLSPAMHRIQQSYKAGDAPDDEAKGVVATSLPRNAALAVPEKLSPLLEETSEENSMVALRRAKASTSHATLREKHQAVIAVRRKMLCGHDTIDDLTGGKEKPLKVRGKDRRNTVHRPEQSPPLLSRVEKASQKQVGCEMAAMRTPPLPCACDAADQPGAAMGCKAAPEIGPAALSQPEQHRAPTELHRTDSVHGAFLFWGARAPDEPAQTKGKAVAGSDQEAGPERSSGRERASRKSAEHLQAGAAMATSGVTAAVSYAGSALKEAVRGGKSWISGCKSGRWSAAGRGSWRLSDPTEGAGASFGEPSSEENEPPPLACSTDEQPGPKATTTNAPRPGATLDAPLLCTPAPPPVPGVGAEAGSSSAAPTLAKTKRQKRRSIRPTAGAMGALSAGASAPTSVPKGISAIPEYTPDRLLDEGEVALGGMGPGMLSEDLVSDGDDEDDATDGANMMTDAGRGGMLGAQMGGPSPDDAGQADVFEDSGSGVQKAGPTQRHCASLP